jgi:hypothetical protein
MPGSRLPEGEIFLDACLRQNEDNPKHCLKLSAIALMQEISASACQQIQNSLKKQTEDFIIFLDNDRH